MGRGCRDRGAEIRGSEVLGICFEGRLVECVKVYDQCAQRITFFFSVLL
jgi:hypothetical protein